MFKGDRQDVTILERLMSGSLAGATAQTIIYPMEVSGILSNLSYVTFQH